MNDLLTNYEKFKPKVKQIRSDRAGTDFIGVGAESEVWRVEVDGSVFALKALRQYSPRGVQRDIAGAVREKVEAGCRGKGIAGLEQIHAASQKDGIVIHNYVPSGCLNPYDVTDEQLESLVATVTEATNAGIEIDGRNEWGNTIYSPVDGFTLIDYWAAKNEVSFQVNIRNALGSLGNRGVMLGGRLGIPLIVANNRER